jgi:capsular exopolysaccharide synthesis family protein
VNLYRRLEAIHRRWTILVFALLLSLVGAGALNALSPAEYTAQLQLFVSTQASDNAQAAYQGAQFSEQRVTSYTELISSERVAQAVVDRLNLNETPTELAGRVSATSEAESVVIDVAVTDTSAVRAADIANEIGRVFPSIVAEVERPSTPTADATAVPVVIRAVESATVPLTPSSLGLVSTLVIGLLVGLVIGAGGAIALDSLDTRIRTSRELEEKLGKPCLGQLPYDSSAGSLPIVVRDRPGVPIAEAFRQIRTNLQFVDVDQRSKVFVLTSSVPSEGKTTCVVNLAQTLGSTGLRVIVVDADLRRPRIGERLGVPDAVGLTTVLARHAKLPDSIQTISTGRFDVLTAGRVPPNPSELLASRQMAATIGELRSTYDIVLIDTAPLLPVVDTAALGPRVDGVILLARWGVTTAAHLRLSAQALEAAGARLFGAILTMMPPRTLAGANSYGGYYTAHSGKNSAETVGENRSSSNVPARGGGADGQVGPTPRRSFDAT